MNLPVKNQLLNTLTKGTLCAPTISCPRKKAIKRWKIGGLSEFSKALDTDHEDAALDDVTKDFLQQGKPEFIQELM